MDIELQVCTLDQAKKLKELGINQSESYFIWGISLLLRKTKFYVRDRENNLFDPNTDFAAFTSTELGVMLPPYTNTKFLAKLEVWNVSITHNGFDIFEQGKTEAEARAELLIRLLQKKEKGISPDESNQALLSGMVL